MNKKHTATPDMVAKAEKRISKRFRTSGFSEEVKLFVLESANMLLGEYDILKEEKKGLKKKDIVKSLIAWWGDTCASINRNAGPCDERVSQQTEELVRLVFRFAVGDARCKPPKPKNSYIPRGSRPLESYWFNSN